MKKIITGIIMTGIAIGFSFLLPSNVKALSDVTIGVTPTNGTRVELATNTATGVNISLATNCDNGCTIDFGTLTTKITDTDNYLSISYVGDLDTSTASVKNATTTTPTVALTDNFKKYGAVKVQLADRELVFTTSTFLGFDTVIGNSTREGEYSSFLSDNSPLILTNQSSALLQTYYGVNNIGLKLLSGQTITNITSKTDGVTISCPAYTAQSVCNLTVNVDNNTALYQYYKPLTEVKLEITLGSGTKVTKTINLEKIAVEVTTDKTKKESYATYYGLASHGFCTEATSSGCTVNSKFTPYLNVMYYKDGKIIGMNTFKATDGTVSPTGTTIGTSLTLGKSFNYKTTIIKDGDAYADATSVGIFITETALNSSKLPVLDYGTEKGYESDLAGDE